jgi:hypothetical protein
MRLTTGSVGRWTLGAVGLLTMLVGCQSKSVGMTRAASGDYTVVQQDSILGMNVGKPHYTDNGKRVDVDQSGALPAPSGSMNSSKY